MEPPQDLLPLLKAKLESTNTEIIALQAEMVRIRERLDNKLKHAPKRPTLDAAGLEDRIEDLEFRRSTSSMSIAAEKEILREIGQLRASKAGLSGFAAFQDEVEKLKAARSEGSEKIKALASTARELRDYVRKLEILERVRASNPGQTITTGDLRVAEIKVAAEHIPRLIGRKGQTLREIEAAAGVTIDVEQDRGEGGKGEHGYGHGKEGGAAAAPATAGAGGKPAAAAPARGGKREGGKAEGKEAGAAASGKGAAAAASAAAASAPGEPVSVKIMGLESGIMTAVGIIEAIAAQVEVSLPVSGGLANYLIARAAAAIKELEAEFGVKLRADREERTILARGSPGAVEAVRARLAALEAGKATLKLDARALPGVMGKGGANLKRLREEVEGAEIEVVRAERPAAPAAGAEEAAAPAPAAKGGDRRRGGDRAHHERHERDAVPGAGDELHVYGSPEAVARAVGTLRSLIEEVRETEETALVPRDAVPWLVGSGGERISAFQKETGVYARVVRADDAGSAAGGASAHPAAAAAAAALPPHLAHIQMRGTPAAMLKARPAFQALMAEYRRCNVILPLSTAQARALVGPAAATIKRLRAETGAAIEVVEHGREEREERERAERDAKRAAREAKEGGAAAAAAAPAAPAAAGKKSEAAGKEGGKGKAAAPAAAAEEDSAAPARARRNRAEELAVPIGQAAVTIRGEADKVAAAVAAVSAELRDYSEARVPVSGSVIAALMSKRGELISALQRDTSTVVDIVREAAAAAAASAATAGGKAASLAGLSSIPPGGGLVVICGGAGAVAAAEARLREIVAAHQERVLALPDAGLIGEIVGKGGANIKALQESLAVSIDVDKPSLALRLTGAPEALDAAVERLHALFDKYSREHATMFVERCQVPSLIGKGGATIKALQEETGAMVHTEANSGELRISGPEAAVAAAKARIAEMLKLDQAVDTLSLDTAALSRLIGKGGANLRRLEEANRVAIAVDPSTGVFTLRGEPEGIAAAKLALKRQSREALRVEEDVAVPQERVAAVIGPKGSRVRRVEADTGCSVDLPRDRTTKVVTVRLRGTPLAVSKARTLLQGIAGGRSVRSLVRPGAHIAALRAPDAIRALAAAQAEDVGTRIALFDAEPPVEGEEAGAGAADSAADLPQGLVLVEAGSDAAANRAAAAVERLLAARFGEGYAAVQLPGAIIDALAAPAKTAPAAAAAGAGAEGEEEAAAAPAAAADESLASIIASCGLEGGALDREGGYVALWGAPGAVAAARESLASVASTFASRHAEIAVDGWMVPSLIGKRGSGIGALEGETGCSIRIERESAPGAPAAGGESRPGGRDAAFDASKATLRVSAPTSAALSAAQERLSAMVADLAKRRVVLSISPSAFGSIIGKGGAVIRGLQEETGATVDLDRDRGLVAIRGPTDDAVAYAREELEALVAEAGYEVREASAADLAVPASRTLHGYGKEALLGLVGRGGANVRRLQEETGARISVDVDRGTVTIGGPSDRVIFAAVAVVEDAIAHASAAAAASAASAASASAADASAASAAAAAHAAAGAHRAGAAGGRFNQPIGAAPLTAEERLTLAAKKGRNSRRRERKRLEKEGLLVEGGEEGEAEDEDAGFFAAVPAPAPAPVPAPAPAPAPAAAAPKAAPVAAAAAAAKPAAAARPAAAAAAPITLLPLGGGAGARSAAGAAAGSLPSTIQLQRLPIGGAAAPAAAASTVGSTAALGLSSNDILARLLGPGAIPTMTIPAAGARPAAAAPAAAPVAAPAPAPAARHVAAAPAPAAAAAPVTIGGLTLTLNAPGSAAAAASALGLHAAHAPAPAAAPAAASSSIGGISLSGLQPLTFAPLDVRAPAAAGGAAQAAQARGPPPGLRGAVAAAPAAAAPAPGSAASISQTFFSAPPAAVAAMLGYPAPAAPVAAAPAPAAARPVAAAAPAGSIAMAPAGFNYSSLAGLGLTGLPGFGAAPAVTALPIGGGAAAAPAPAARPVTALPIGGAGAPGSAAAAAALALGSGPAGYSGITALPLLGGAGSTPITSLAALLSSPSKGPAPAAGGRGSGAQGGRGGGRGGAAGGVYSGAGGVNVRL